MVVPLINCFTRLLNKFLEIYIFFFILQYIVENLKYVRSKKKVEIISRKICLWTHWLNTFFVFAQTYFSFWLLWYFRIKNPQHYKEGGLSVCLKIVYYFNYGFWAFQGWKKFLFVYRKILRFFFSKDLFVWFLIFNFYRCSNLFVAWLFS